jgi:hypothetical protein
MTTFPEYYKAGQSGPDSRTLLGVSCVCQACALTSHTTHFALVHNAGANRFPFNNFTRYFTPFSRCFSSFPHGTCSLSVSCQYLALDEVYHPIWAAFPNNSTLRECLIYGGSTRPNGILTLCDGPFQDTCARTPPRKHLYRLQFGSTSGPDFKFELFPLHSQLLRESLLVSFPPLTDMLKFSG